MICRLIGNRSARGRLNSNCDYRKDRIPKYYEFNVNLILKDGCKLEAKGGIAVNEGNSLTIYAQSNGDDMGELIAEGASVGLAGLGNAGIGGCLSEDGVEMNTLIAGDVTVHGGKITAIGTKGGAGIGGASGMKSSSPFGVNVITKCGNIIIYGGDITAEATDGGAGIGVGRAGEGGSISIYSKAKIGCTEENTFIVFMCFA